jgi:hypothetical protein
MVRFLIIDRPSAYNAILGRIALNDLKAVTSTPHLSMKFPTEKGVGVEKGNQRMARACYNTRSLKLWISERRLKMMGNSNHRWGSQSRN